MVPTSKMITTIGYQGTTVTVMSMTTAPATLSITTIENTVLKISTTAETTTMAPAPSSSDGEETTTITEPGLLMTNNTTNPAPSYKAKNTYTNTYTMLSIGKAKETGLLLYPGGVTQGPSHSDNSYLSSVI